MTIDQGFGQNGHGPAFQLPYFSTSGFGTSTFDSPLSCQCFLTLSVSHLLGDAENVCMLTVCRAVNTMIPSPWVAHDCNAHTHTCYVDSRAPTVTESAAGVGCRPGAQAPGRLAACYAPLQPLLVITTSVHGAGCRRCSSPGAAAASATDDTVKSACRCRPRDQPHSCHRNTW